MLKLLKGLKPYKTLVIFDIILVAIQGISELFLPNLMSTLLEKGIQPNTSLNYILSYGALMLLLALISIGAAILGSFFASKISSSLSRDIRNDLFKKVNSFSLSEFNKISTSSLITRSTNDVTQIQNLIFMMLRLMMLVPVIFTGSFILTLTKEPSFLIIILIAIPIMLILVGVIAKIIIPLFSKMQKKVDSLTKISREILTGVRVIRAFDQQEREAKRFEQANKDVTDIAIKVNKLMAVMMPFIMLIMNLATVAIIWFGAEKIQTTGNIQKFSPADLSAIIQYMGHIMFSIIMVTMMFVQFPRGLASAKRINEVLDLKPEITDKLQTSIPEKESEYAIEFNNVSFNFGEASLNVIDDISFKLKKGKTTAIVGSTGSGKSTLLNMIARFYEPTKGEILVNGENIQNYTLKDLRAKLGFIPQKAFLFSGTIADNIRYGKLDASDEEILEALETAQATEFINEKENGINSHVSQGGANFSGGQKQRLAIARALVRKPKLLIFDDSFSALDFKTDSKLRSALNDKFKDSTILIVAQRISTVFSADKILVLNEGKLVGEGTHKELLKSCKVYREIAESQLEEEELQ